MRGLCVQSIDRHRAKQLKDTFVLKEFYPTVNDLEASPPSDLWCVPGLIHYHSQFLILDRCTGFVADAVDDCFEFVSQWSSQEITHHFETLKEARSFFERVFEYTPDVEWVLGKPMAFERIRTVEIRDHCFHGADQ